MTCLPVSEFKGNRPTMEFTLYIGKDLLSALGWATDFYENQNKRLCFLLGGTSSFLVGMYRRSVQKEDKMRMLKFPGQGELSI